MKSSQGSISTLLLTALVLVLLAGVGWFLLNTDPVQPLSPNTEASSSAQGQSSESSTVSTADSAIVTGTTDNTAQTDIAAVVENALKEAPSSNDSNDETDPNSGAGSYSHMDITTFGLDGFTDEEFAQWTEALKADPALRNLVIEEFRSVDDPNRARRLGKLLGQFKDQSISEVASSMAFSGNQVSRQAGLYLLGLQQPVSDYARTEILNVLGSESDSDVKIDALNALGRPTAVSAQKREPVVQQLEQLVHHQDAKVRSHAMSIMSRWGDPAQTNSIMIAGLQDEDEKVRQNAVFALSRSNEKNDDTKAALFSYIRQTEEPVGSREGAMLALKKHSLSSEERAELADIEAELAELRK